MTALWTNQTFEAPFTDDIVVVSDPIPVTGYNSFELVILYESFSPDSDTSAVNYRLQAIIERELVPNVWVPVMGAFKRINGISDARHHVLTISPIFNIDPGNVVWIDIGGSLAMALSPFNASVARLGNLRVSVVAHRILPSQSNDLAEVTLSADYRLYEV